MKIRYIGIILMASGDSKRFGSNKLLADFGGTPVITWTLRTLQSLERQKSDIKILPLAVTRSPEVEALCTQYQIPCVRHSLPHKSDTIRIGIQTLIQQNPGVLDGCVFLPGDQPLLTAASLDKLMQICIAKHDLICRLSWQGTPGSPVIFPPAYFAALQHLPDGGTGRDVISQAAFPPALVEAASPQELMDCDTPQALNSLKEFL